MPENPDWKEGDWLLNRQIRVYSGDRPEVHEVVREMRAVADEYEDKVLIGEIYLPLERLLMYYGEELRGVHLPFNFQLVTMEGWDARTVRTLADEYEAALPEGAWPNWVLGNHDVQRIATRVRAEVPLPGASDDRPWRVLLSTCGEDREGRELRRAARLSGHEGLLLTPDHS